MSIGQITPSKFKELFDSKDSYQIVYADKFKNWITNEDMERYNKDEYWMKGYKTDEEVEFYKQAHKQRNPHLFNQELNLKYQNDKKQKLTMQRMGYSETDLVDEEYYFDESGMLTLPEHIAHIERTIPNCKITLKKDIDGRIIIKRDFKSLYKYDLEEILKFDPETEAKKLNEIINTMNFSELFNSNVEYLARFYSKLKQSESNQKFEVNQQFFNTLETNFKVAFKNNQQHNTTHNLVFLDFANFTNELSTLNATQFQNLINYSISLLTHSFNSNDNKFEAKNIGDGLTTSSYKILYNLLMTHNDVHSLIIKSENSEFNEVDKFHFIQNKLINSVIEGLCRGLNQTEIVLLHGFLNLLPRDDVNDSGNNSNESDFKAEFDKMKQVVWKCYKDSVMNNKTSSMFEFAEQGKETEAFINKVNDLRDMVDDVNVNKEEINQVVQNEIEEYETQMKGFYKDMLTIGYF